MKLKVFFMAGLLVIAGLFTQLSSAEAAAFTVAQQQAIGKIVHQYLLDNPQVLIEVSQKLQQQQEKAAHDQVMTTIPKLSSSLFFHDTSPVLGNPKGSVTLVEFYDARCPHCKEMSPIINELLKQHKNLRVVLKEWPIFGGPSAFAAEAALAARNEPKFADFHNALLETDKPLTKKAILNLAKQSGIDPVKLQATMKNDRKTITAELKNTFSLAQQLRLQGTPAFIVVKTPATTAMAKPLTAEALQLSFIPGQTTAEALGKAIAKASE